MVSGTGVAANPRVAARVKLAAIITTADIDFRTHRFVPLSGPIFRSSGKSAPGSPHWTGPGHAHSCRALGLCGGSYRGSLGRREKVIEDVAILDHRLAQFFGGGLCLSR